MTLSHIFERKYSAEITREKVWETIFSFDASLDKLVVTSLIYGVRLEKSCEEKP